MVYLDYFYLYFIVEFICLYVFFELLPLLCLIASSSILFSAAYTMYMYNRIAFGGSLAQLIRINVPDLNKREFYILLILIIFTVLLGIYPIFILDGLHYSVSSLIYSI